MDNEDTMKIILGGEGNTQISTAFIAVVKEPPRRDHTSILYAYVTAPKDGSEAIIQMINTSF